MKSFSLQRYLNAPAEVERLAAELEEVRRENESLRGRLVGAQKEKGAALRRAEEFRGDKERLRQQIVELKRSLSALERVNEQLGARVAELQEAAEAAAQEE